MKKMEADREEQEKLLADVKKSIPSIKVLSLLKDREDRSKQIVRMEEKLMEFGIRRLSLVNSPCVKIPTNVIEPTAPIKPNRALLIGVGLFTSFSLGIGLVCLLEHVDHSVKVPEQVSQA